MAAQNEIRQVNDDFYKALNEMFKGSLASMQNLWSHGKDVTLEGPFGGIFLGYEDVIEEFRREADMHLSGYIGTIDALVRTGADLAYVTCTEVGQDMTIDGKPVAVSHRATNIFRKEGDNWKIVHHHTDQSSLLQAAAQQSVAV